jgi:hypothetical protein
MPPPKPQIADEQGNTPPEPARREQAEAPARAAPATVAAPPRRETSRETTGHAATDAVQDAPAATKSERRQRRDASRRERGNETAGETRRSREASRRSRAAEDEEDVDMVVREHRLPDGRRVIIQRRGVEDAVDDEGSARRVIIQRRTAIRDDDADERAPPPGLRLPPFFINPFGER